MGEVLGSWRDGATKDAIVAFVHAVTQEGPGLVPIEERLATFDNDGTLWCEKPMPIQLDFILRRLYAMADARPELRDRQPWKAAYERDYAWLGALMDQHYAGDDTNVKVLARGILAAYEGVSVNDFEAQSAEFLRGTQHPTLGRGYLECAYAPMIDLLDFLSENGFTNYIASGGGRDFMRPITQEVYGIPQRARDRKQRGARLHQRRPPRHPHAPAVPDTWTTGPRSPSISGAEPDAVRVAGGNSNGDSPCWSSRSTRTSPLCECCSCTTTLSASSTTRAARSRRSSVPAPRDGPS